MAGDCTCNLVRKSTGIHKGQVDLSFRTVISNF